MSEHLYRIKYTIERGEWMEKAIREQDAAGCDCLFYASIMRGPTPHGSAVSTIFVSIDGYTGDPLPPTEIFRTWGLLAYQLMGQDLPPWMHLLCSDVHDTIRKRIARGLGHADAE
jgi:hypothetical protein